MDKMSDTGRSKEDAKRAPDSLLVAGEATKATKTLGRRGGKVTFPSPSRLQMLGKPWYCLAPKLLLLHGTFLIAFVLGLCIFVEQ